MKVIDEEKEGEEKGEGEVEIGGWRRSRMVKEDGDGRSER